MSRVSEERNQLNWKEKADMQDLLEERGKVHYHRSYWRFWMMNQKGSMKSSLMYKSWDGQPGLPIPNLWLRSNLSL